MTHPARLPRLPQSIRRNSAALVGLLLEIRIGRRGRSTDVDTGGLSVVAVVTAMSHVYGGVGVNLDQEFCVDPPVLVALRTPKLDLVRILPGQRDAKGAEK